MCQASAGVAVNFLQFRLDFSKSLSKLPLFLGQSSLAGMASSWPVPILCEDKQEIKIRGGVY